MAIGTSLMKTLCSSTQGGWGGEATQFLQCTTFALEVLLYNASAADPQLWFINLCYQLYPCSPHMCMDKWPRDTVDHLSILVCLSDHRVGSRECEHIHLSPIWDPIPPIRCHTGSIGMVANYYLTLASLMAG